MYSNLLCIVFSSKLNVKNILIKNTFRLILMFIKKEKNWNLRQRAVQNNSVRDSKFYYYGVPFSTSKFFSDFAFCAHSSGHTKFF